MKKAFLIVWFMLLMQVVICQAVTTNEIWSDIHPRLSKALDKLGARGEAPESSWNPLVTDRQDLRRDINEILNSCVDLLGVSDISDIRAEIAALKQDSRESRERIAELKTARLGAPEKVEDWKFWKKDMADIEEAIDDNLARIGDNERRIDGLIDSMVRELGLLGISATREQVETLVYSVTATDDVRIIAVFHNVKFFTAELKGMTADSGEDISMARRYYGMHTMLMNILVLLYDNYIDAISKVFLPRIDAVIKEQGELMRRTEVERDSASVRHRDVYEANLRSQQMTMETARLYRRYLTQNRDRVLQTRDQVFEEFKVAENTFETVQSAHALIGLMRNASAMLGRLTTLQAPDLMAFSNREMRKEFQKLTIRMESGVD